MKLLRFKNISLVHSFGFSSTEARQVLFTVLPTAGTTGTTTFSNDEDASHFSREYR